MALEKVNPVCKYGHGDLERQGDLWGVEGFSKATSSSGTPLVPIAGNDQQFVMVMYRCPRCGYLELFDNEEAAF